MLNDLTNLFKDSFAAELKDRLKKEEVRANEAKDDYAKKLDKADSPAAVFKYFLLISVSQIESYVAQTRSQAQLSFALCKRVATSGFIIIAVGVLLAMYSYYMGDQDYTAAKLAALSGVLTQMISSVFFYFFNRTIEQFNLLTDKLVVTQDTAISLLAGSNISDCVKRDDCSVEVIKLLLSRAVRNGNDSGFNSESHGGFVKRKANGEGESRVRPDPNGTRT